MKICSGTQISNQISVLTNIQEIRITSKEIGLSGSSAEQPNNRAGASAREIYWPVLAILKKIFKFEPID